jgi:hypothetical protein
VSAAVNAWLTGRRLATIAHAIGPSYSLLNGAVATVHHQIIEAVSNLVTVRSAHLLCLAAGSCPTCCTTSSTGAGSNWTGSGECPAGQEAMSQRGKASSLLCA